MPDPRYPDDPLGPRDLNPRDPRGGVGSTLNPLRDHVQGEPEPVGGPTPEPDPPAVDQARDLPPSSEPNPPGRQAGPHYDDPTKP